MKTVRKEGDLCGVGAVNLPRTTSLSLLLWTTRTSCSAPAGSTRICEECHEERHVKISELVARLEGA